MPVTYHKEDILPHIELADEDSLARQTASPAGCVTVIGPLQVCYEFSGSEVKLTAKLFGVEIGSGTVDLQNPSITIGGSVDGAGAEVEIKLEQNPLRLRICGKVKYVIGSKEGCVTIQM